MTYKDLFSVEKTAVIQEKMAGGISGTQIENLGTGAINGFPDSALLNQNSLQDLQAIRQTLIDQNLAVRDLQFLISEDGRIVVNDPQAVMKGNPILQGQAIKRIDILIDFIQNNLH